MELINLFKLQKLQIQIVEFWRRIKKRKYTSIRRVDENGNIVPLEVHFNNPNRELLISQADYLYTDIIKQANKLQEDILPVGDEVVVDTSVSSHTNPEHYMRDQLYQTISNPADAKLEKIVEMIL